MHGNYLKEQDEKAKACEWINEELSTQELLEEMSKCKYQLSII